MILVNSQKAKLIKFNRINKDVYFDDVSDETTIIKVVPYDVDDSIRFGIYTVPEATGYFIVNRNVDIREGDQIQFIGKFLNTNNELTTRKLTVLKVQDAWTFNRLENQIVAVK
jgi:hypothetical protein